MKKRIIMLAAALIVGAGTVYAVGTGYVQFGVPTQAEIDISVSQAADAAAQKAAEEMRVSSAAQQQTLAELEAKVEQLEKELQKPSESTTSVPPEASTTSVPAVPSSAAPQSNSAAMTMSAQASSSTAPAKATKAENAGTVFEGYTVTVTDKNTPAVRAAGNDWPITKYYFIAADGTYLGSISGAAMNAMIEKYMVQSTGDAPGGGGEWEFWFAEEFNAYRGITGSVSGGKDDFDSSDMTDSKIDTDDYALKVIELTNAKRREEGLDELEIRQDMMELAQVRAEEIAANFSHVRPDGVRISSLGYGENISKDRDTPAAVVKAWMNSDGHKENILTDEYKYIGIGCYIDNGTLYWVQLFSWNEKE